MDSSSDSQKDSSFDKVLFIHCQCIKLKRGLKNSSSIFYHAIMEIFKDNLTSSENAQENVAPEKKLKTTKTPLIVFHDEGNLFW